MKTKYDDDLNYDKQSNLPIVVHNYITKPPSRPANSVNLHKNTPAPAKKAGFKVVFHDFLFNAGRSPSGSPIFFLLSKCSPRMSAAHKTGLNRDWRWVWKSVAFWVWVL